MTSLTAPCWLAYRLRPGRCLRNSDVVRHERAWLLGHSLWRGLWSSLHEWRHSDLALARAIPVCTLPGPRCPQLWRGPCSAQRRHAGHQAGSEWHKESLGPTHDVAKVFWLPRVSVLCAQACWNLWARLVLPLSCKRHISGTDLILEPCARKLSAQRSDGPVCAPHRRP